MCLTRAFEGLARFAKETNNVNVRCQRSIWVGWDRLGAGRKGESIISDPQGPRPSLGAQGWSSALRLITNTEAREPVPPPHPAVSPRHEPLSPPSQSPRRRRWPQRQPPGLRRPRGRLCCCCCSRCRRPRLRAWKARSREAGVAEGRPRTTWCSFCVTRCCQRPGPAEMRRRPRPGRLRRNELVEEREDHPNAPFAAAPRRALARPSSLPLSSSSSSAGLGVPPALYLTAGITSTRVGGVTRVTEVRKAGWFTVGRRVEGEGKESERGTGSAQWLGRLLFFLW